ncbi:inner-membrane translocator [Flammeovirgaceae bacterium 311]|nr:inner-membrane translocator [Flammeovirgaceae bacterium 311]
MMHKKILFYLCLLYYVIMALFVPGFFSINNSWNLIFNLLPLLIAAVGQTYVIITGGIDLSATAVIATCSVVGGYIMSSDFGPDLGSIPLIIIGVAAMMAIAMIIGLINGLSVLMLGMPSFMVTLATMIFFSGLAVWLTQSQNIYNLPEEFNNMFYTSVLGIPIPIVIGAILLLLSFFILNKTVLGQWIYSVGMNVKTSKVSGVRVGSTTVFTYVFSGFCLSIAAILYTSRLETGSPVMGQNILLDIIGAVIIGGTSLYGGKGKIYMTVLGAIFIILLDNSLNLIGLSFFMIMIIKGAVILTAVLLNDWKKKSTI